MTIVEQAWSDITIVSIIIVAIFILLANIAEDLDHRRLKKENSK